MTRDRRLYLFDIDGTLINTGGAGSSAMRIAFAALWRIEDGFKGVEFSGRTDRAIFRDAHAGTGLETEFSADLRRFKRAYYRRLVDTLRACDGTVLQGVVGFLNRLHEDERATVSLGTGNFRSSAAMKLRYYGIDGYFRHGGFGDSTEERALVIAQGIRAAQRAAGRHGTVFVIGDTVHDIAAAKANNAVAVGVATGPADEDALAKAGADIVLPTLESAAKHLLP
jgi:phosphoglycolate phosphatase-like HAD superfamily hydrolase